MVIKSRKYDFPARKSAYKNIFLGSCLRLRANVFYTGKQKEKNIYTVYIYFFMLSAKNRGL